MIPTACLISSSRIRHTMVHGSISSPSPSLAYSFPVLPCWSMTVSKYRQVDSVCVHKIWTCCCTYTDCNVMTTLEMALSGVYHQRGKRSKINQVISRTLTYTAGTKHAYCALVFIAGSEQGSCHASVNTARLRTTQRASSLCQVVCLVRDTSSRCADPLRWSMDLD
jgi:hypothetical protein